MRNLKQLLEMILRHLLRNGWIQTGLCAEVKREFVAYLTDYEKTIISKWLSSLPHNFNGGYVAAPGDFKSRINLLNQEISKL